VVTLLTLSQTISKADVGKITEQTGPTEIQRNKESIPAALQSTIEMNDSVVTANARVGITFKDDTRVQITEQSKLLIDSFVFDPNKSDSGKIAMKAVFGSVRYASGAIAHANPENVKIDTPTATIGVRGTDFTMTVDELGRSLIILLPSCPVGYKNIEKDCKTGKIVVHTDMGDVMLDKPFQSTLAVAREKNPTKPVILKLDPAEINNMLILTPPKEVVKEVTTESKPKTALDINFLDQKFLDTSGMLENELNYTGLDINRLDTNFLVNLIDVLNQILLQNMLDAFNATGNMLPNYQKMNQQLGLKYTLDGDKLILYKENQMGDFAQVTINKNNSNIILNLDQGDNKIQQQVNKGGTTVINIKQGN
jgi:FecR protein